MTRPVRIPADVNRPDRVLGPLTARQVVLLAVPASVLYVAWTAAARAGGAAGVRGDRRPVGRARRRGRPRPPRRPAPGPVPARRAAPPSALPPPPAPGAQYAARPGRLPSGLPRPAMDARATPGRRGPPSAALRRERRVSPGPLATATTTGLGRDPTGPGVLDLGADGLVAIAALSTINLGLRTPTEQDALAAGFARYLHTITGSVQFLIRTIPLDLSGHLQTLREQARALPHPALVAAAHAHRAHLAALTHPPGDAPRPHRAMTARKVGPICWDGRRC